MKSVGQILRDARLAKKLSLADCETATKIRQKFLDAIEKDDFSALPSINYAKGFVKNYSEFLGLNSKTVLAFFRRQTTEIPRSAILPKDIPDVLKFSPLRLTPGRFVAMIVIIIMTLFLGYFSIQYQSLGRAPKLIVTQPQDQEVSQTSVIEVIGQTDGDATVTINGVSVLVRSDGKFFDKITLNTGTNIISIVATSRYGKTSEGSRTVIYKVN